MKQILSTVILCLATINVFAQGTLNPATAPAMSMKSLDQIEPRTPISSLPSTIASAGVYYLTTNLTLNNGSGIQITTNNVTLDLGGFTLTGNGASANDGVALIGGRTNVVVRHGIVTGWSSIGVDVGSSFGNGNSFNIIFEDLQISGNGSYGIYSTATNCIIRNCLCSSNVSGGIYSSGGVISGCQTIGNKGSGIQAGYAIISDCQSSGNGSFGFFTTACHLNNCDASHDGSDGFNTRNSDLQNCHADGCAYGITALGSSIRNCQVQACNSYGIGAYGSVVATCLVQSNLSHGIYINAPGCQIVGNLCNQNNLTNNSSTAGIFVNDANNRIEDNHLFGNGTNGYGIYVQSGYSNNIIVKNSVTGNGIKNYLVSSQSDVGPIGSATNSTSPWANISH